MEKTTFTEEQTAALTPCDAVFEYTESRTRFGARILSSACVTCGVEVCTHLLKSAEELYYWCDRVITREDAIRGLKEIEACHRAGVSYDAYMGFRDDGEEMTEEEYSVVRKRMKS